MLESVGIFPYIIEKKPYLNTQKISRGLDIVIFADKISRLHDFTTSRLHDFTTSRLHGKLSLDGFALFGRIHYNNLILWCQDSNDCISVYLNHPITCYKNPFLYVIFDLFTALFFFLPYAHLYKTKNTPKSYLLKKVYGE